MLEKSVYEAAFNQTSLATLIVESAPDFLIVAANISFARRIGKPCEAIVGRSLREFLRYDEAAFATACDNGGVIDVRLATQPTQEAVVVCHCAPLHSLHQRLAVLQLNDLREYTPAHARLVLADRLMAVGTLASGIAHEINNPLTYILANATFLEEEFRRLATELPPENLKELLTVAREIREGAEQVRRIVHDLRSFAGYGPSEREPLDILAVLQSALQLAINEIKHRARLAIDLKPVPLVMADRQELGQVFLNLLINAAQAIPEGQAAQNQITVTSHTDEQGWAVIRIQDTGVGIPKDHWHRIFDPFFSTKPMGTGLGLAISHGIVESLGGRLAMAQPAGGGTLFTVALQPARPSTATPDPSTPFTSRKNLRVLVIDDEPAILSVFTRTARDHHVTTVSSGADALTLLQSETFDCIFCDLMMPNVTGMDLYEQMQATRPELASRFVFLTGGTFTERAQTFLQHVRNPVLQKPFHPDAILALLNGTP